MDICGVGDYWYFNHVVLLYSNVGNGWNGIHTKSHDILGNTLYCSQKLKRQKRKVVDGYCGKCNASNNETTDFYLTCTQDLGNANRLNSLLNALEEEFKLALLCLINLLHYWTLNCGQGLQLSKALCISSLHMGVSIRWMNNALTLPLFFPH